MTGVLRVLRANGYQPSCRARASAGPMQTVLYCCSSDHCDLRCQNNGTRGGLTAGSHRPPLHPQRPFKWVFFSVFCFFPNRNRTKMISEYQMQTCCCASGAGSSFLWSLRLRTAISSDGAAPPVPFRPQNRDQLTLVSLTLAGSSPHHRNRFGGAQY